MKQTHTPQPTLKDLMLAISQVQISTQHSIDQLAQAVHIGFAEVDERFNKLERKFDHMTGSVGHIENVMVTKDYLDSKLSTYKGEQTKVAKREDRKLITAVNLLEKKQIFTHQEAGSILEMESFTR